MKPTTLEEALSMVPTHWPLIPEIDILKDGDEVLEIGNIGQGREFFWDLVRPEYFGNVVEYCEARRPIPQEVRESAAWWLLHMHINDVSQSLTDELMEVLGGRERFKKEISAGPDPLGRWILAGKP